ncbi:MAG: complex I NDUFA9 subunit family protein, partial [Bosea sp. (in: a-proteobacteria)]
DGKAKAGATYELGGPEQKSFRQLVESVCEVTGRKRLLASLPFPLARLQAGAIEIANKLSFGLMPDELLLTRDQVELLKSDNVVSPAAISEKRTLAGLGITPTSVEAIVPSYLWRFRKSGQFDTAKTG